MDNPLNELTEEELDLRGVETAWGPWRRVGDHYEPAAPLAAGPTRYRARERTERRYRWREPYVMRSTYPSPSELDAGEWVAWDDEIRPGVHWFELPAETLESFSPDVDRRELVLWRREDTAPRNPRDIDRWGRLRESVSVMHAPEAPDVIPWNALTPGEQASQRLIEYELPMYEVTVPDFDFAGELTPAQEGIAALMAEPPGGENQGRTLDEGRAIALDADGATRGDFLRGGGWRDEYAPTTGESSGRPRAWRNGVPQDARASLVEAVGVDPETVAMLYVSGQMTDADRQTRDWVDGRIALVVAERRGTGVVEGLAAAYGVSPSTIKRAARRGRE